jgi:response regulator RpfG family c-di-GMP phosphodiesterase
MANDAILFVDDEPAILATLKMLFKDDFTVYTAEAGSLGLDIIRKTPIKVVISDQRMPYMLGHEFLREVRTISPNTVRMLLTGYSDLDSVMNSVNAGEIFRYINKPWKTETLENLVRLGIRIYDRVVSLQEEQHQKAVNVPLADAPKIHIEIEEKNERVLFVDYLPDEVKKLAEKVNRTIPAVGVASVDEAFKELSRRPVSVIVSNVNFSDYDPFDFLKAVQREYPQIVTMVLTELNDASLAVRSINEIHAFKYLVKPKSEEEITIALKEAVSRGKVQQVMPSQNIREVAEEIAPPVLKQEPTKTESELRLRLRSLQSLLTKK